MKGFVYILKNKEGKFYVGSTSDIRRRVKQHQRGHTQTTRNMSSFDTVLVQEYPTLEAARKVELKIKRLKRKEYIARMVKDGYIRIA